MPFHLTITGEAKKQIRAIMDEPARVGLQKQLKKSFGFLSQNPKHPGLNSHQLEGSENVLGMKVFTSYVQNKTPQAHRILWTYGKNKNEIIVLAVLPHY